MSERTGWDEADALCCELEWYGTRKINLAKASADGKEWADVLLGEVSELRALLKRLRAANVAGEGP